MKYNCEVCKYNTSIKRCYSDHLQSDRHKHKMDSPNECFESICIKCKKVLLSKTSLWRHNKVCDIVPELIQSHNINAISIKDKAELLEQISRLIDDKNQNFFEKFVSELSKNPSNNITNITNNNNNNFTIMFLNEKCGSAINMLDFINSIIVNTQTLQQIESQGYVEGVAKLVIDNLNLMSVQTRPLHYTNTNNTHAVYTRKNNEWTEETERSEPVLEHYMQDLDEKLYTEMLVYQEETSDPQVNLKEEILKANMLTHSKVTDKILCEVIITKELINNIQEPPSFTT